MITNTSLEGFYEESSAPLPSGIAKEIGHFNVFVTETLFDKKSGAREMPYSRRAYYKISWIRGKSRAEYADKTIDIPESALLFATPKIPYNWIPETGNQTGMFCIFTADFLAPGKAGVDLDDLPLFQPGQVPVFQLTPDDVKEIEYIFKKMHREIGADYKYKYDLLRNLELAHNASERISSLFIELLERQFPIDSQHQRLKLRAAKDYADRLAVHVNHLNKVLKEVTGNTTTQIIANRIIQEAKILLKQTNWNIAEISYTLGFDDIAHFSNFFKKQTSVAPLAFRGID